MDALVVILGFFVGWAILGPLLGLFLIGRGDPGRSCWADMPKTDPRHPEFRREHPANG